MVSSRFLALVAATALAVNCGGSSGGGGGGGTGPDTTPPAAPNLGLITVTSPLPGTTSQIVGSNGAVEGASTVKVVNADATQRNGGGSIEASIDAGGGGNFTLSIAAQLGDQLTLTATDQAGNESVPSLTTAGPVPQPFNGGVGTVELKTALGGTIAVDLPFPTGAERYTVIAEPQNPGGGSFSIQLSGAKGVSTRRLAGAARPESDPSPEARIRRLERAEVFPRLREVTPQMYERRGLKLAQAAERMFFVSNKLGGDINNPDDFDEINAVLRFQGDNVLIYVDDRTPPADLTEAMIQEIGNRFDDSIFPTDVTAFGNVSDVDGDGRLIFLMSPTVNALNTQEIVDQDAFIGGFFFGLDLLPAALFPTSNEAEIFYAPIPDPDMDWSPAVFPINGFVDSVSATAAHEVEHMISANEHILVRLGQAEDVWLDEGLAHYAETINNFNLQNRLRSALFLEIPSDAILVGTNAPGDDSLSRRGGAWLLVMYLVDRFGSGIVSDMVQTSFIGIPNVEQAANTSFPFLSHQFYTALVLDGQGITNDPNFNFSNLNIRNEYALAAPGFDPPLGPFLDMMVKVLTVNGSTMSEIIRGTGAGYYDIGASEPGTFPILVSGDSSSELQLSVIRTE
jgi:hypothetical protein